MSDDFSILYLLHPLILQLLDQLTTYLRVKRKREGKSLVKELLKGIFTSKDYVIIIGIGNGDGNTVKETGEITDFSLADVANYDQLISAKTAKLNTSCGKSFQLCF